MSCPSYSQVTVPLNYCPLLTTPLHSEGRQEKEQTLRKCPPRTPTEPGNNAKARLGGSRAQGRLLTTSGT